MRILFLRTTSRVSGAEMYNLNLLSVLICNSSVSISLITNLKPFIKLANKYGIHTIEAPWLVREIGTKKELLGSVFQLPGFVIRFLKTIKLLESKNKIDIVCLQSMTEKILLTPFLRLFGYKVIWIEHGPLYSSRMTYIIKWLYLKMSNLPNKIIAVSQNTKTDLIDGGVSSEKLEVIYIGVNTDKFKKLTRRKLAAVKDILDIKKSSIVIGFLGTVTMEKGIKDFLVTSVQLIQNDENFLFLIIGNGPDLLWMKRQVNKLNMGSKYRFVGFVDDVKKYLGIIDIFLFPTLHNEGISMAMLEAQSMEKVVITRDIGGNSEIIHNNSDGYLYKKWDNKEVCSDVIKLITRPRIYCEVKKFARDNIKARFNISKQANDFYRLFASI